MRSERYLWLYYKTLEAKKLKYNQPLNDELYGAVQAVCESNLYQSAALNRIALVASNFHVASNLYIIVCFKIRSFEFEFLIVDVLVFHHVEKDK